MKKSISSNCVRWNDGWPSACWHLLCAELCFHLAAFFRLEQPAPALRGGAKQTSRFSRRPSHRSGLEAQLKTLQSAGDVVPLSGPQSVNMMRAIQAQSAQSGVSIGEHIAPDDAHE